MRIKGKDWILYWGKFIIVGNFTIWNGIFITERYSDIIYNYVCYLSCASPYKEWLLLNAQKCQKL